MFFYCEEVSHMKFNLHILQIFASNCLIYTSCYNPISLHSVHTQAMKFILIHKLERNPKNKWCQKKWWVNSANMIVKLFNWTLKLLFPYKFICLWGTKHWNHIIMKRIYESCWSNYEFTRKMINQSSHE